MSSIDDEFEYWWHENKDRYTATPLMRRCFAGGYERAMQRAVTRAAALVWVVGVVAMIMSLYGCQDRYRYPCQDPLNWEKQECQRPICAATQSCPDQLTKPEEMKGEPR